MNKTTRILLIVGATLLCLLACGAFALISSYQSSYNNLVDLKTRVPESRANMNSGLRLMAQKIQAVSSILDQVFTAEQQVQVGVAEARSGFDEAWQSYEQAENAGQQGNPMDVMQAAGQYLRSINVAVEATPTTNFATLGAQAMGETAEAYNQMSTLIADYNGSASAYNAYRQKLFMPKIVGDSSGFPAEYAWYDPGMYELPTSYDDLIGK